MITIGMASYGNPDQLWFTIQGLRIYQDVKDCEILVVDNQGNENIKKVANDCQVRYELDKSVAGPAYAKGRIFDLAKNSFVLVIDSHVLLYPNAIKELKGWLNNNWDKAVNLIHGPMVVSSLKGAHTHYEDVWRGHSWGTWSPAVNPESLTKEIEIKMMGTGLFGCRKDSWLGFHKGTKGFGGHEGVIHEKYRRNGRKVISLPFLKWVHKFGRSGNFPLHLDDRIRNYLLGFKEINLDPKPIYEHFGKDKVKMIAKKLKI